MQALQQDEPLRNSHLRRGGRKDEAGREDQHLPADHGKYERSTAKDCMLTLHRTVRGTSRVNGTDHVHQTEIEHRQQSGRGGVFLRNNHRYIPDIRSTSMLTCAMRNSNLYCSMHHSPRLDNSYIISHFI